MSQGVNPYVYEKFSSARSYMAKSPRSLKERIEGAYTGWLFIVFDGDIPDELKADFSELKSLLTSKPRSDWQNSIEISLAAMHWRRVRRCADLIVSLAYRIEDLVDPNFDYGKAA